MSSCDDEPSLKQEVQRLTHDNELMRVQIRELNELVGQCLEKLAQERKSHMNLQMRIAQLENCSGVSNNQLTAGTQQSGQRRSSCHPTPKPRLKIASSSRLTKANSHVLEAATLNSTANGRLSSSYGSSPSSSTDAEENMSDIRNRILTKLQTQQKQLVMLRYLLQSNGVQRRDASPHVSSSVSSCHLTDCRINSNTVSSLPDSSDDPALDNTLDYENVVTEVTEATEITGVTKVDKEAGTKSQESPSLSENEAEINAIQRGERLTQTQPTSSANTEVLRVGKCHVGKPNHRAATLSDSLYPQDSKLRALAGSATADPDILSDIVDNQLNERKESGRLCPSCGKHFFPISQEAFERHATICAEKMDTNETLEGVEMSADELRTCPICSIVFPQELGMEAFECHVMHHFASHDSFGLSAAGHQKGRKFNTLKI